MNVNQKFDDPLDFLFGESDDDSYEKIILKSLMTLNESSSENNEETSSSSLAPKRSIIRKKKCGRKPSFRPQFMEGLRIYKTDIRRKYPDMYANVMNSLDSKMIARFFYEFCSPNIMYERKDGNCLLSALASALVPKPVFGLPQYVKYAVTFLTTTILSDMIIRLRNPKLITTKGVPGSRIEADNILEVTVLYSAKRIPFTEISQTERANRILPSTDFEFIDPITNEWVCLSLLPIPVRVRVHLSLVLTLDSSNHINGVYLTHQNSLSTPVNPK